MYDIAEGSLLLLLIDRFVVSRQFYQSYVNRIKLVSGYLVIIWRHMDSLKGPCGTMGEKEANIDNDDDRDTRRLLSERDRCGNFCGLKSQFIG